MKGQPSPLWVSPTFVGTGAAKGPSSVYVIEAGSKSGQHSGGGWDGWLC